MQTKSKPKKKKPKNERKQLVKQLDDVVREICRKRDKGQPCGRCGKQMDEDTWQVSHFIGRRHYALRWDLRNVAMQHAGCNLRHSVDPNPYALWIISKYGPEILVEFEEIKKKHTKFKIQELRDLLKELNEM